MDEIRCGEPDCTEMASPRSVVEIANLTGGMMGGLFANSRVYECSSGHVTTLRTWLARLKASLKGTRNDHQADAGNDASPHSPPDHD